MPQRNGKNPIKSEKNFGQIGSYLNDSMNPNSNQKNSTCFCPSCKAEVPSKPGFRLSSLKCPKCGSSMSKH